MPAIAKRQKRRSPQERSVLTPPEIALILGVADAKIIAFIRSGELRAFNGAIHTSGRPRFLITREALDDFIRSRSTVPTPKPVRARRAAAADVIRYF